VVAISYSRLLPYNDEHGDGHTSDLYDEAVSTQRVSSHVWPFPPCTVGWRGRHAASTTRGPSIVGYTSFEPYTRRPKRLYPSSDGYRCGPTMLSLPNELLVAIMSSTSYRDVCAVGSVCAALSQLVVEACRLRLSVYYGVDVDNSEREWCKRSSRGAMTSGQSEVRRDLVCEATR
jgi:hypothetical protein